MANDEGVQTPALQLAPADPPGTVGALVWGILGLNLLPLIGPIIALVLAGNARDRAQAQGIPEPSMARAGRVLAWVGLILILVPLAGLVVVAAILGAGAIID